jgi:hypothetical protein
VRIGERKEYFTQTNAKKTSAKISERKISVNLREKKSISRRKPQINNADECRKTSACFID